MNYDNKAREDYKKSPASVVYWVFLASYLYYVRDESILSDETFDKMMKLILDKNLKHSLLSHLITEEDLRAGSLFRLKPSQYPNFIAEAGEKLLRGMEGYLC
jgi:hypothetical protein